MRLHHKAIAFLSVGLVLLIFGKISKVTLFHAYVKTLEEIEVRNHQGLEKSPALYKSFVSQSPKATVAPGLELQPQLFGAWFRALMPEFTSVAPRLSFPSFSLPGIQFRELFPVIAPRAP